MKKVTWDQKKIIVAIDSFIQKNGRFPIKHEFTSENGLPSPGTIIKYFGTSSTKIFYKYFPHVNVNERHNKWDKEKIITAIDAFIQKNGRFPSFREFRPENGLPSISTTRKVLKVGLDEIYITYFPDEVNERKHPMWNREKIVAAIDNFAKNNGRFPSSLEFTLKNKLPSRIIFKKHFGMTPGELHEIYNLVSPNNPLRRKNKKIN